ncbi:glycoside hydrolase family 76 protein [Pterulicium gracile]|uniref:Glycoside hydrolase family 76 protein n=1 Tax=Pterulicium gracile TaxID=1884261 RepID=A0A5C3QNX1_9AGAR|nr:glycoside hydrolase family 76 protein [Pterula gracilis]
MRLSLATTALLILRTFALPSENRGSEQTERVAYPQSGALDVFNPPPKLFHLWDYTANDGQCVRDLERAHAVAERMQSHYWNSSTGYYNTGNLWGDANTYETLLNLMLASGSSEYTETMLTSLTMKAGADPGTDWVQFIAGSNDDAGWIILALIKMSDYLDARGEEGGAQFLNSAIKVCNIIGREWDDTCGGGLWWSTAHTYKNAITNELFFMASGTLYLRTGQEVFLENAKLTWTWLLNSGMRNAEGLWNDGLTDTCENNGQETWSYNQVVVASGLSLLYAITGDESYLTEAEISLDATISLKTENGILRESCDDVAGSTVCDNNQVIFKGIWTKHVQFYLDNVKDDARTAKYSAFLGAQSSGVFHYGTNGSNDVGTCWYAPDEGGSTFGVLSTSSGMAAHVASAKYGGC